MVWSASVMYFFAATPNALRKVKLRSWFARIIWSDWTRSSAVFHTSTSAASSMDLRGVVVGRHLLLHPEEDARVVLAPGERRTVADHPALGEALGLCRLEHHRHGRRRAVLQRRRDVGEGEEHVVALAHLLDVAALEHREPRARLVPLEAAVHLRVVVEHGGAAVARVEHEDPVGVLYRGVHREGQQLARTVERNLGHAAEQLMAARAKVEQQRVVALARWGCRAAASAAARPATARCAAAAPAGGAARVGPAPAQDEVRRGGREDERPDVLPGSDRPRRQVPQLDAPRRYRRRPAAAAGLARLPRLTGLARLTGCAPGRPGLRRSPAALRGRAGPAGPSSRVPARARALRRARIHLVRDPRRVGREVGVGRIVDGHVRARLEVEDVQNRLRLGRDRVGKCECVGHPLPVARDLLAGDAAPLRVVVDRERLLRRGLRPRQRVGGKQRARKQEHEDGGTAWRGWTVERGHVHVRAFGRPSGATTAPPAERAVHSNSEEPYGVAAQSAAPGFTLEAAAAR